VAHFSATIEKYARAIEIFEQVTYSDWLLNFSFLILNLIFAIFQIGTASIENQLLKYGARDHFFRAGLCHLCVDHLNCQQAIARYETILAAFADSREGGFLKALIAAVDENNLDNFTNAVKEYDSTSRLDNWCTTLLLRVKKNLNEEPDLR
jgi:alpha-soluble NSF attachment protein